MEFKLLKEARFSGGDKYVCSADEKFVIYFPQRLCRLNGKPLPIMKIRILSSNRSNIEKGADSQNHNTRGDRVDI